MNLPTNPIVQFKNDLRRLVESDDLALPSNVSPEAFRNAAIVAVQDNPKILMCTQDSVFKSIRRLAAAGLVPDGREAALVPFKSKIDGNYVDVCQAMPMVFGLIKMVRRSGTVTDIRAHIVYQKEIDGNLFQYVVGDEERLTHTPILFGEKGPAVAAYAIAKQTDGTIVREFMDAASIDVVRRASSAQRKYEKGKAPATSDEPIGIWLDWASEMWKKTVIRRLCKRLDMSSEDVRRVMESDEFDGLRDVTPGERKVTPGVARLQAKVAAASPQEPETTVEVREPDEEMPIPSNTGDVEDAEEVEHWTEAVDTESAFPGSDDWTDGIKAFKAGMKRTMCPHEADEAKAIDWLGGFDGARKAAS